MNEAYVDIYDPSKGTQADLLNRLWEKESNAQLGVPNQSSSLQTCRDISGKHCLEKAFLVILESSTALSSKQLVNPMLAKFYYKYVLHIHIYIAKTGTI